jgi:hypothetical protein
MWLLALLGVMSGSFWGWKELDPMLQNRLLELVRRLYRLDQPRHTG